MIYLDNASTTRPCDQSVAAMTYAMTECFGNPSSQHRLGFSAEIQLKDARRTIASHLGSDESEIFFTSGGTEADNWAILGAAEAMKRKSRHIIVGAAEHHAVLEPAKELATRGFEVTYLNPDADGRVSVDSLKAALRPDTILVSLMLVNNETGAINDIPAMTKALKSAKSEALFHTDAVQAFLKIPLSFKKLGVDLMTISGHKVHAPKGIGALVVKKGKKIKPLLFGGGQQNEKRPGTEPMPGIIAFSAACKAVGETLSEDIGKMTSLRDYLTSELENKIPQAKILCPPDAPHIVCITLKGARSQGIINCLSDEEVYVSAGSACSRGKRSHVLTAMDIDPLLIDCAIRVSLSRFTTADDIDKFISALKNARDRLLK